MTDEDLALNDFHSSGMYFVWYYCIIIFIIIECTPLLACKCKAFASHLYILKYSNTATLRVFFLSVK